MLKFLQLIFVIIAHLCPITAVAARPLVLQTDEIVVVYEAPLANAASEVVRIYSKLRREMEDLFGWNINFRPQVVLVDNTQSFRQLARNELFVAFAVPDKKLIVIDYTRMNTGPFTLSITLKHELCHLLLHRHIPKHNLPKWLDEGVSQRVSDGIGEIFINPGWSGVDSAVLAGRVIPLKKLTNHFPRDKASMILAYEQSKSLINYVDRQYGHHAILNVLDSLKNGEALESAFLNNLGLSHQQLEKEWLDHLERTPRWLVFLAGHIYGIIFFLAAGLTCFGFIRYLRRRKKIYEKWREEDDE
jgi:hypothetical protein